LIGLRVKSSFVAKAARTCWMAITGKGLSLRQRMWPLYAAAIRRHLAKSCRIGWRQLPWAAEIGFVIDHLRS
jgi:hypothetical protein